MEEQFKTLIVLSHYLEVCLASSILFKCHEHDNCKELCHTLMPLLHVQTARFRQFWDEAAKSRHILEVVPGM